MLLQSQNNRISEKNNFFTSFYLDSWNQKDFLKFFEKISSFCGAGEFLVFGDEVTPALGVKWNQMDFNCVVSDSKGWAVISRTFTLFPEKEPNSENYPVF